MRNHLRVMKTPMLLALTSLSISTAQAAEPKGTLTLACKGEKVAYWPNPEPVKDTVSAGIIVDLAAQTVSVDNSIWLRPMPITRLTETTVTFLGKAGIGIIGSIDRATADFNARTQDGPQIWDQYSLKCKPT